MIPSFAQRLAARARRSVEPKRVNHWKVALRKGGPFLDEAAVTGTPVNLTGFSWIESPVDHYYADPFLFERDGSAWLFVEDFDYSLAKGSIAVARLGDSDAGVSFGPCVVMPYHLSFPLVFEEGGSIFMIPESAEAHQVTLFRSRRFPTEWKAERVLLKGDYVDTVVWHEAHKWWLLAAQRRPPQAATDAVLLCADSLNGDWRVHPASPLFRDAGRARNAGAIIHRGDKRYRVSQDCSAEYGRSFGVNEITQLTDTIYNERSVVTITSDYFPGTVGTHTYNRAGDWEAIDGCFRELERRVAHRNFWPSRSFRRHKPSQVAL
jgi:hypothetical protein